MFFSVTKVASYVAVLSAILGSSLAAPCSSTSAFVSGYLPSRSIGINTSCSRETTFAPPTAKIVERKPWSALSADVGGGSPTVLDRPEIAEKKDVKKEDELKEDQKHGSDGWEVRLYNDPMNKREFVARCLTEICGMSDGESYQVMMQAHQNGLAVVGRYIFERAEMYHDALRDNGLFVDMIQVDDD